VSMIKREPKDYSDGRTKQGFKDSTDINKLIAKAQRAGTISHLQKHGAFYGDFTDMPDLLEAQRRLQRGQEIFDELPSEVRREFNQSPAAFFKYVNDPANKDDLARILPALAKPGTQVPAVRRTAANQVAEGTPSLVPDPPEAKPEDSGTDGSA